MRFRKQWLIALVGVLVSLFAIYSMSKTIDFDLLVEAFRTARYIYVLPAIIFIFLGLAARGYRWHVLLTGDLAPVRAFNIMNVAYMVNGVLPLRLGEVARAYLASRADARISMVRALSTIIVERLLDVIAVLVLLGISITAAPLPDELRGLAAASVPAVLIAFVLLVGMSNQRALTMRIVDKVITRIPFLGRIKLNILVGHFLDGLSPIATPKMMLRVFLWTAISWFFSVISGYALMPAFFDAPDLNATYLFSAAASFANALPAMPASIGIYEYSILISFQSLGYSSDAAILGFAVTIHLLNVGLNLLLGIFGLFKEGISLSQLSEQVKGIDQPATR